MEKNNVSMEHIRADRARAFLRDNTPSLAEYDDYLAQKVSDRRSGMSVWAPSNINDVGSVYHLYHPKNLVLARLVKEDVGNGQKAYNLYIPNESAQGLVTASMQALRGKIDPDAHHDELAELQVLGLALELADRYVQQLDNN